MRLVQFKGTGGERHVAMTGEDGKPAPGETGVRPEWFYKGDGECVVPPEAGLASPEFALEVGVRAL